MYRHYDRPQVPVPFHEPLETRFVAPQALRASSGLSFRVLTPKTNPGNPLFNPM